MGRFDSLDELVEAIGKASYEEREALRDQLLEVARTFDDAKSVMEHLEHAKRSIPSLEARWEVDEVIESITPPPVEEAPEEPVEQAPTGPLTADDLDLMYDDPRGLQLYKTKVGERWVVSEVDPNTGRPNTFELPAHQVDQLRMQLMGSPYWVKKP